MAQSKYPESGLSAVLDLTNWSGPVKAYLADVDKMNRADTTSERSAGKSSAAKEKYARTLKFASDVAKAAVSQFQAAGTAIERSGQSAERSAGGISRFTERLIQIDAGIRILNTAADVVSRVADGVADMAGRAMRVEGIGRAFRNVISPIGDAEQVLARWREQAQYAVSDLDLMRMGNVALINTSRESRDVIGQGFGIVVRAAFAGAAATGQDFTLILEKMTRGLRRQSNMLLDDIGAWVDAEAANRRYAETHGLVVSQMNEAQRAAAWQAEAIRQMTTILQQAGDAGITYVQRASAEWQNAIDRMAVATEAGSSRMDYGLGRVFSGFADLVDRAAPYAGVFASEVGNAFAAVGDEVYGLLGQLNPADFFAGGANIIAALARGILSGLTLVVQAANVIAQSIANLLMGFSPPPEGPLSTIDVGGQNVIQAWLEGFERVSTAPAEKLAGEVNGILAGVGNLDAKDQVTVLEQLQKRLQSRLETSVAAMMRGEGGAEEVRALDSQRVALARQLELLRERAALEQVGVRLADDAADAQRESLRLAEQEADTADRAAASSERQGRAEKDRLADLQDKLRENRRLQDAYLGYGRDTTGLLQEEARLRQQIADETIARGGDASAMLADVDAMNAELERRQRASRGGGAGVGVSTGLGDEEGVGPLAGAAAGAVNFDEADMRGPGQGVPVGTNLRTRLSNIFSGIQDDYRTFVTTLDDLRDTLGKIDFLGGIEDFLKALGEDPGAAIGRLADALLKLPGDVLAELVTGLAGMAGIELDPLTIQRISDIAQVIGGFVALKAGIAGVQAVGGAISTLIGLGTGATPIGALVLALSLLLMVIDRFGPQAAESLRGIGDLLGIGVQWIATEVNKWIDDLRIRILEFVDNLDKQLESVGIDIGVDVTAELDNARLIQERDNLYNAIRGQLIEAATGGYTLSPEIQMLIEANNLDFGDDLAVRAVIRQRIQAGLDAGDPIAVQAALNVARVAGVEVEPDIRAEADRAVREAIETGQMDVTPTVVLQASEETITAAENVRKIAHQAAQHAVDAGGPYPVNVPIQVNGAIGPVIGAPQTEPATVPMQATAQLTDLGYEWNGQVFPTLESLVATVNMESGGPVALDIQSGETLVHVTDQGYQVGDAVYSTLQEAIQAGVPLRAIEISAPVTFLFEETPPGGFGALPAGGGMGMGGGQLMSGRDAAAGNIGPLIDVLRARYLSDVAQPFQEQFTGWTDQVAADTESIQSVFTGFFDTTLTGLVDLGTELLLAEVDLSLVDAATLRLAVSVARWYAHAGVARSTLGDLSVFLEGPYFRAVEVAKNITEGLAAALERVVEAQQMSGYGPAGGIPYGGARAGGGPVEPGYAYRVGENGPEWFTPIAAGQIIPQSRLSPPPIIVNVPQPMVIVEGRSGGGDIYNNWNVSTSHFDAASVRRYYEMQARGL